MKILLFEPIGYAHSVVYLRRMVAALEERADVIVAVPDELVPMLDDLEGELISLGAAPAHTDALSPLSGELRRWTRETVRSLDRAINAASADHALVLSADVLLHALLRRPAGRAGVALLMFRPRTHYPSLLGSAITPRERMVGELSELLLRRWRGRSDALAVFTLDPVAAERWAGQRGAPAIWLPEPPVLAATPQPAERAGLALVGSLAARKGLNALTRAAAGLPQGTQILIAGAVDGTYGDELQRLVESIRAAGVSVALRTRRLPEAEILTLLGGARCAVLPYQRHMGMSRVLLEAAIAETPVVVNDFGLLAHLVRRHELGEVVDCSDPRAFARTLTSMLEDDDVAERYRGHLQRFARRFNREAFAAALARPFSRATGSGGATPLMTGGINVER